MLTLFFHFSLLYVGPSVPEQCYFQQKFRHIRTYCRKAEVLFSFFLMLQAFLQQSALFMQNK